MKTRNLTPEQQAARDARKAKQKELFARLAKMNVIERAQLAQTLPIVTCDGHALSVANMCLIALQGHAHATVVGGFRQWLRHGRCVRKGEHGATIRVPAGKRPADGSDESGAAKTEDAGDSVYFVAGTVFDVSQTDEVDGMTDAEDTRAADAQEVAEHETPNSSFSLIG